MKKIFVFALLVISSTQFTSAQHHTSANVNLQVSDTLILKQILTESGLQNFETPSNSNKKRFTIEQAKTDETRTRRIEKAVSELSLQRKV